VLPVQYVEDLCDQLDPAACAERNRLAGAYVEAVELVRVDLRLRNRRHVVGRAPGIHERQLLRVVAAIENGARGARHVVGRGGVAVQIDTRDRAEWHRRPGREHGAERYGGGQKEGAAGDQRVAPIALVRPNVETRVSRVRDCRAWTAVVDVPAR